MSRLLLVTNDDGIRATGLEVLARHLAELGQVVVVAPDQERSAVGHGISLSRPLRIQELGDHRYAVSGTPADCVLLGLFHICPQPPDLVVSGINLGVNLGTDTFYSGTVAGAVEGAIHGVAALAVSQELPEPGGSAADPDSLTELGAMPRRARSGAKKGVHHSSGDTGPAALSELLERTAHFATRLAAQVMESGLPAGTTLNLNAPRTLTERFAWTRLGRRAYREQVERRLDLRGTPYYWIGGPPLPGCSPAGTDAHAVENGLLSITPLGLDLSVEPPEALRLLEVPGFAHQPWREAS